MIRFLHLSLALILGALLSACGSYVVSAAKLKQLHKDDVIQTGHYSDKDFHLNLIDGEASYDKICLSVDDQKAVGSVHFIPTESGIISIVSNLSITDEGVWTPVQGEMIYYLKKEAQNILVYDPVTEAYETDKNVPFMSKCKNEYSGTLSTLSDYNMQSYCLKNSVEPEDISRWFDTSPLGEVLANLRPSDKNKSVCDDRLRS